MAEILLIAGSPSLHSRSAAVLHALSSRLKAAGLTTQLLRVRDLPAEALLHGHAQHREITDAVEEVNRASVVFVATPIYKASLAGILKAFLDLLPQNALSSKPVLPLGTGGSPAHLLAVEYALKPVLAALGAQVFFPTLYIQDTQIVQLEPPQFEPDAERRLSAVVEVTTAYFVQHPVEVKVTT